MVVTVCGIIQKCIKCGSETNLSSGGGTYDTDRWVVKPRMKCGNCGADYEIPDSHLREPC
jgi:DNA-directed RNA polymerase subunit RPC12/RpoP